MKHLFKLSLLLLALLLPATALAHDFEVDGIFYNINGNEATVTSSSSSNKYSGDVTIPATVTYNGTTYSVTAIGNYAFYGCSGLTSATIPNSVTSIGDNAFYGCNGLTSINIPNSVTSIGNFAFYECSGLTSIIVASGNPEYDSRNNCNAIIETSTNTLLVGCKNTVIPNTVTAIGSYAFSRGGLTSITIPNSVTSIGNSAFYECTGLTSVTIGNSVTSIGNDAFYDCSSLTSITIPNSVTSISNDAFSYCSGLTSISVSSGNPTYDSRGNCNAIIESATNTLITGCMNTVIPNSITSIGDNAFAGCSGLTSINIPNSVTFIGLYAFSDCSGLISVYITDLAAWCNIDFSMSWGFPYYGRSYSSSNPLNYAGHLFLNEEEVTDLVIPNTVTNIKDGAFVGCGGLTSVTIPNSVTEIGAGAFYDCCDLTSVTIGNSVTTIGIYAFYECSGLTSITIGNSVISIGDFAFYNCHYLANIQVASGNPKYDSRNNCNAIIETASNTLILGCSNTVIPNSVTSIGGGAFGSCWGLTSVDIPNSVTSIGGGAFYDCWFLPSVTIGNSVTSIGGGAFGSCWSLTEIYCLALVPPTLFSESFDYYYPTLYVYDIAMDAYQSAEYWKDFTNIVGIPYTFEVDGTNYQSTTLNTVSVMAHSDEATLYSGDVVIPDSVAYEGYTYEVTGIESNAFDGCYELTSVVIPNSVETIGEQAFQGCTGLTSVTIGSGVIAIGAKAFNYCNALETVKCLGTLPPMMASADCFSTAAYNRATLLVPRNSEATYTAADYWYKFAHIDGWGSAGQGDVNGDGVMSITDVTSLIDVLLGHELDSFYFDSADLNSNGRLDIGDVTSLIDNLLNGDY